MLYFLNVTYVNFILKLTIIICISKPPSRLRVPGVGTPFFFFVGDETGLPGRNCSKVSEDIWGNNWVVKASILNVGRLCRRCMSIFHLEITKR